MVDLIWFAFISANVLIPFIILGADQPPGWSTEERLVVVILWPLAFTLFLLRAIVVGSNRLRLRYGRQYRLPPARWIK